MEEVAIFARWQPIYDVVGRLDYITSAKRQENLLAVSGRTEKQFWKELSNDAQQAWRESGGARRKASTDSDEDGDEKRACEAREIQFALPRVVLSLSIEEQKEILYDLVRFFHETYGLECVMGLHVSKTKQNIHIHILYAERQRLPKPLVRIAARNIFLDETGIRKRTKKEILDETGNIRTGCRIIPKGEVIHTWYFGEKDAMLSEKSWSYLCKNDLADWINKRLKPDKQRVVFDPMGPYLAQVHIGKAVPFKKRAKLLEYNEMVKRFNKLVRDKVLDDGRASFIKSCVMRSPERLRTLGCLLADLLLERPYLRTYLTGTLMGKASKERLESIAWDAADKDRNKKTSDAADAAKKQELRVLYREAERYRQLAREATSEIDKKLYWAKARECSARIDRCKRALGLFTDEDYAKKLRALNRDLKFINKGVSICRARVYGVGRRIEWQKRRIDEMTQELNRMPILFKTKECRRREQQLQDMIKNAEKEIEELKEKERVLWGEYLLEERVAKEKKKAVRQEKAEMKVERKKMRQQQKITQICTR